MGSWIKLWRIMRDGLIVFRERAAIFDHTVRGALSPSHTSRAPAFATQDHARARDSNAAQGNTQDTEATSANLFRKECQGCSQARRPSRPTPRIQSSGAIVTSQPWIQLTGGYAFTNLMMPRYRQVHGFPMRPNAKRYHSAYLRGLVHLALAIQGD